MSIDYPTAQKAGYFGTYVNDDWRISKKLTLNVGLRYDFDIPRTDRYNRLNWLDIDAPSPIADVPQIKAVFPNQKGIMRFADDKNRGLYLGDYNNVQPRFGFAYALDNKTSIRAGYGLFYVVSRHSVKGEIGTAFKVANPGVDVVYNFGSSATLATQLKEGAPADAVVAESSCASEGIVEVFVEPELPMPLLAGPWIPTGRR